MENKIEKTINILGNIQEVLESYGEEKGITDINEVIAYICLLESKNSGDIDKKKKAIRENEISDEILEIIDSKDEMTRGDIQGCVEAIAKKALRGTCCDNGAICAECAEVPII